MKSTEGLPETCLSHHRGGWEPPSHHRWHLVSSTCRDQHVFTNDTSINLTLANCSSESITWNSKAPPTCFAVFPATWLQHECISALDILPLEKCPIILVSHFLLWRWIQAPKLSMKPSNYLLKMWTNFCLYCWKQMLWNQDKFYSQLCHLLAVCPSGRLDFTSMVLFSHLWCRYTNMCPIEGWSNEIT